MSPSLLPIVTTTVFWLSIDGCCHRNPWFPIAGGTGAAGAWQRPWLIAFISNDRFAERHQEEAASVKLNYAAHAPRPSARVVHSNPYRALEDLTDNRYTPPVSSSPQISPSLPWFPHLVLLTLLSGSLSLQAFFPLVSFPSALQVPSPLASFPCLFPLCPSSSLRFSLPSSIRTLQSSPSVFYPSPLVLCP